jgi:hypothetical protein
LWKESILLWLKGSAVGCVGGAGTGGTYTDTACGALIHALVVGAILHVAMHPLVALLAITFGFALFVFHSFHPFFLLFAALGNNSICKDWMV